jgi:hypothetical protein
VQYDLISIVLQETSQNVLPEHQLGFRRLLTGIYAHTSAHIVAAPMAHYLAKNMSRFLYSHNFCHLPVHGIDNMLMDRPMIMNYQKLKRRNVTFHNAMNYFYRPTSQDKMCMYEFFSKMEFISKAMAEKMMDKEYYTFIEGHPYRDYKVAIKRDTPCVPVFQWSWLPSTSYFTTSMLNPINETDSDFRMKEEYAYKFLILFLPFRSHSDLKYNGSYQGRWQYAYEKKIFSKSMVYIANNIQTIRNSLGSSIPDDIITYETTRLEIDETPAENCEQVPDNDPPGIDDLFAMDSSMSVLVEETTKINLTFGGRVFNCRKRIPENVEVEDLTSTVQYAEEENETSIAQGTETVQYLERFSTSVAELNSLALQQVLMRNSMEDEEASDFEEESIAKTIVNATGTWQSIVAWGINAQLDTEQQSAFEILASCYVLTFYEEARQDGISDAEYLFRKESLCQLARRDPASREPLRMFITGPAGAGKCKCKPIG